MCVCVGCLPYHDEEETGCVESGSAPSPAACSQRCVVCAVRAVWVFVCVCVESALCVCVCVAAGGGGG